MSDKVSMLTHTYPQTPEEDLSDHRLTANFLCGLISDMVICKFRKCMVIHNTECPYWGQVSLNNTNQTILQFLTDTNGFAHFDDNIECYMSY